jgi:rubrerythrin
MAKSTTSKDQTTKLENSTFNILIALGKEAQFLYSTIDTYISDAQKDNNSELETTWNTIKEERKRHMDMLRKALEKETKEEKLSQ